MTKLEKTILPEKNGIVINLMDSFRNYETADSPNGRLIWEAEFNHWYRLTRASSTTVAEKYMAMFEEIKEGKR